MEWGISGRRLGGLCEQCGFRVVLELLGTAGRAAPPAACSDVRQVVVSNHRGLSFLWWKDRLHLRALPAWVWVGLDSRGKARREEERRRAESLKQPAGPGEVCLLWGVSDNPVSHNGLESNRIWQYLWAVVRLGLYR